MKATTPTDQRKLHMVLPAQHLRKSALSVQRQPIHGGTATRRMGLDMMGWRQYATVLVLAGTGCLPFPSGTTAAQWHKLRQCESTNNPKAVSVSGKYRGYYQFDQKTWDSIAQRIAPNFVGVKPDQAPPVIQHKMAHQLFVERGWKPWPSCGRKAFT